IAISAKTGVGLDKLIERIRQGIHGKTQTLTLQLPMSDGKSITFLENRTTIHDREYVDQFVRYTVTIGARQMDQLRSAGARIEIIQEPTAGSSR
ncbi:MAG TPA: hypothetical protein DCM28_06045, partial [Phycisphaerales bacterium]|nr:hypothetical protein [Phycisphaerales bacterium]